MTSPGRPRPMLDDRCVLVVEDQYLLADEMSRMLQRLGGRVLGPARDLASARALVERGPPDLAILDINLGEEHVWVFAQELRFRGVPMIFASGYEATVPPGDFAGEQHLEKPVTVKALAATLGEMGFGRN